MQEYQTITVHKAGKQTEIIEENVDTLAFDSTRFIYGITGQDYYEGVLLRGVKEVGLNGTEDIRVLIVRPQSLDGSGYLMLAEDVKHLIETACEQGVILGEPKFTGLYISENGRAPQMRAQILTNISYDANPQEVQSVLRREGFYFS